MTSTSQFRVLGQAGREHTPTGHGNRLILLNLYRRLRILEEFLYSINVKPYFLDVPEANSTYRLSNHVTVEVLY